MSNSEFLEAKEPIKRLFHRENVVLTAASLALAGSLVSCSATEKVEGSPLPERNTPSENSYSLDTAPIYFNDVRSMKSHTEDPALLEGIDDLLDQPVAQWLTDDSVDTRDVLRESLAGSKQSETIPMFVAYNIPNRDLGSYSAGGVEHPEEYTEWVQQVSDAIGDQPTVMIIEPDALPQILDMDEGAAEQRIDLLAQAVDTFAENENTAVYLDAGNSAWLTPEEAASLIQRVADKSSVNITGISLNVSNYQSEEETRQYATEVQEAYGSPLYIMIDNSRNGAPDAVGENEWCNPEGQRLGESDSLYVPTEHVETAFIKTPGQSDGECESGISTRPAGEFDGDLLFHQLGQ